MLIIMHCDVRSSKAHLRNCTVNRDKNLGAATGNAKTFCTLLFFSEPSP